jgi:hypothetical protein
MTPEQRKESIRVFVEGSYGDQLLDFIGFYNFCKTFDPDRPLIENIEEVVKAAYDCFVANNPDEKRPKLPDGFHEPNIESEPHGVN